MMCLSKTLLVLLLLIAIDLVEPAQAQAESSIEEDAVVVVVNDPRSERRRRGLGGPGYRARLAYQDDPALRRLTRAIAKDHALEVLTDWPIRNLAVHCIVVRRPSDAVLSSLSQDPRVRWVQSFNEYQLRGSSSPQRARSTSRLIRRFHEQTQHRGEGVRIAVIDTAVDQDHPDLQRSKLRTQDFVAHQAADAGEPHGTAVVGLIAATPSRAGGLVGAAPGAQVSSMRGCWQNSEQGGRCNTLTLTLALDAAVDWQPDVLNLSLTGPADRLLNELLKALLEEGTLVISAYDDERPATARFPVEQDGVIYAFGRAEDAQPPQRDNVFSAPRHAVSLTQTGGYDLFSGHSVATPQLSAMAACLISRYPRANRNEIVNHLRRWLEENPLA